jgi:hypothetical protein
MLKLVTELVKYTPKKQDNCPAEYAGRIFTRTVSVTSKPFLQYWLMDEDGHNCFASGSSFQAMLFSAQRRVELDAATPDLYCEELQGYTFSKRSSSSGPFVEHVCSSPDGEIMGVGITRASASEMALYLHCAQTSIDSLGALSFKTFKRVAFAIPMRKSGKDGYLLEGDLGGMDQLRKAVSIVWEFNPSLHGSVPVPQGQKWSEKEAFVRRRVSDIVRLNAVQMGAEGVGLVDLSLGPQKRGKLTLVFFDSLRVSKEQALRTGYQVRLYSQAREDAMPPPSPGERQRA